MVWTRALGPGMQEGTPLVHDGVMYFPNPSDVIQAFDAASGDVLWEYRRSLPADLADYFPVSSINRNLAIYGDSIIDTSADDFVFALDARTGELQWQTKIFDYQRGAQQTSGPIIANGKIISGPRLRARGQPGGLRDHGARREHRARAVAPAHDRGARRAERRFVGQHARRGSLARRQLARAELRSCAQSRVRRHVGHVARAEVRACG